MCAVGVVASGLTTRFDVGSFKEFGFASAMVCVLRHTWFEWWSTRGSCNRPCTVDKARAEAHCPACCLSAFGVIGQGTNVVPPRPRAFSRVT